MLFLCFAVKDRLPLINDFYHYLSNFGLDVWYDRSNIYLGDHRWDTNIKNGAESKKVKYAVVFYSENFRCGNICLDEFDILVRRYNEGEISIFPVFLSDVPEDLEDRFELCKTLVYKQIHSQKDFMALSLHIIAKITSDELKTAKYQNINDIQYFFLNKNSSLYKLIMEYKNIKCTNYNMRIAFLFALFIELCNYSDPTYYHYKTMSFIYHQNCLDILVDEKRELQIMENIIVYYFAHL